MPRTASTPRKTKVSLMPSMERPLVTREQIAQRAYELYQMRGGTHGADLEDWLQAECELAARSSKHS